MKHTPKLLPLDWMEAIWSTEIPSNSKLLACYLRSFMNAKSDMAWPSYSRIIAETGLKRSTVAKHFNILEEEGWIARNRGRKGKNTEYIATIPKKITNVMGSALNELGSAPDELCSSPDELEVVHQTHSNKQVNKQVINNNNTVALFHSDETNIFEYWKFRMGKNNGTKLIKKRKDLITARLKEGYTVDDIKKAIDGCAGSPYHMGQNERGTVYDDIELICRSGIKVENFRDNINKFPPQQNSNQLQMDRDHDYLS